MAVSVSDGRYHRPSTRSDAIDQLQRHSLVEINNSNLTGIGKRHVGLQQQIDEYINRHDLRADNA